MSRIRRGLQSRWLPVLASTVFLLIGPALSPAVRAADTAAQQATSLQAIPEDAAFYTAMLRNREQVEAVASSKAWAKLMALPSVQMGLNMIKAELQPGGKLEQLADFYAQPENKELLELLAEMASDEIFVYGDQSWVGLTDLAMQAYSATRFGPAV